MSVWVHPEIARIIAELPGVHAEVIRTAHKGARILKRNIAVDTGRMRHETGVDVPNNKDAFFGVRDPGFIPYNYGHFNLWAQRPIVGSHVIEKTIAQMMS